MTSLTDINLANQLKIMQKFRNESELQKNQGMLSDKGYYGKALWSAIYGVRC